MVLYRAREVSSCPNARLVYSKKRGVSRIGSVTAHAHILAEGVSHPFAWLLDAASLSMTVS